MLVVLWRRSRVVGTVTADPGVDFEFVPDGTAEELMDREVQPAGFEVPECDVEAREGGYEDGAAAIEAMAMGGLPDVFDVAVGWRVSLGLWARARGRSMNGRGFTRLRSRRSA